ncbi:MAG: hypothetical protein JKY49_05420 [Cohaesibacteraceae bacterium]|nr:hypothetical protein [Cohaesibacteraceae bacterium]MBL4876865.1 hypothetical protein [Cohaesibacteraceae bacterium]
MSKYVVMLKTENDNTEALIGKIFERGGVQKLWTGSWLISSNSRANDIRDGLKKIFKEDDQLAIFELQHDWSTFGTSKDAMGWLKQHLKV